MTRKGILLAGGSGSRLYPVTRVLNKQLLPIYDKPMVYYPLSLLMLARIREVLIISTPRDLPLFDALLGDGSTWGMHLHYQMQESPSGIAQGYLLGDRFLAGAPSCLVLGDNIFHGAGLTGLVQAVPDEPGATVFAVRVEDPHRYGVVTFADNGRPQSLVEKPQAPCSPWALTGLYYCDGDAPALAAELTPSARGELEIVDLLRRYLERGTLRVHKLPRGTAWLDTGTHEAMAQASQFVHTLETRQGRKIGCPEEIAWDNGWIDDVAFAALAHGHAGSGYGAYLRSLLEGDRVLDASP
jgi:glucose-1-phosphate thymidylyltransferase